MDVVFRYSSWAIGCTHIGGGCFNLLPCREVNLVFSENMLPCQYYKEEVGYPFLHHLCTTIWYMEVVLEFQLILLMFLILH